MKPLARSVTMLCVLSSLGAPARAGAAQAPGREFTSRDLQGDYVFSLTLAACREPRVGNTCASAYCRYSGQLAFDGVDTVNLSQLVYCTDEVPSRTFSSHGYVVDEDGAFQIEGWFRGRILERRGPLRLEVTTDVGGEAFVFYGVATAG